LSLPSFSLTFLITLYLFIFLLQYNINKSHFLIADVRKRKIQIWCKMAMAWEEWKIMDEQGKPHEEL